MIALIHLLAVASPGPDFAIILKQSILYGRRTAIFTSLGIGTGIMVHVTYSLIGVGLIIAKNEILFNLLKYIAAAYFCYIAWHGLRAKKPGMSGSHQRSDDQGSNISHFKTSSSETSKSETSSSEASSSEASSFETSSSEASSSETSKNTGNSSESSINNSNTTSDQQAPSDKKAFAVGFFINALNVKATLFFVALFSVVISIDTPFAMKLSYGLYMIVATALWFITLSYFLGHQNIRKILLYKGYWLDRFMGLVLLLLAIELVMSDLALI
ncbi:MAG: LysE family translocator [Alteromonadaceae bacterium]|nr:LysE family translocator [Alteromonadaceae bacterium]